MTLLRRSASAKSRRNELSLRKLSIALEHIISRQRLIGMEEMATTCGGVFDGARRDHSPPEQWAV